MNYGSCTFDHLRLGGVNVLYIECVECEDDVGLERVTKRSVPHST